jgi:phenylacetate-coenzyme A ligase PaaK-like adenylate-forming protein
MFLPQAVSAALIRTVDRLQGRGVWRTWERLEASQWWSPARLREIQEEKLGVRLREAGAGSALVARRLARAGIGTGGAVSIRDLRHLPALEREDLRAHLDELRASNLSPSEVLDNSTGGSTGTNVRFFVDRDCWRWRDAVSLRLPSFLGLRPGAAMAVVWGSPMDAGTATLLKERLRRLVDNRRFFSAYRVGADDLDPLLDWLARRRPAVLMGYASVLDALARRALDRGGMPGPGAVLSAAEVLFADQRRRIASAWGASVHNLYGCREVGTIAVECGAGSLHTMDERLVLELLPPPAGEAAEILVTDLDNRATPFLRYRIGDLAVPGPSTPCACGRGLGRLGEVTGRSFDLIRSPGGQAVGGTFWSLLLRTGVEGIDQFQVVQTAPDRVEIHVSPVGCLTEAGRARVRDEVRRALGSVMEVGFSEHERLEPLPSGKHRFIVALPASRPESPPGRD